MEMGAVVAHTIGSKEALRPGARKEVVSHRPHHRPLGSGKGCRTTYEGDDLCRVCSHRPLGTGKGCQTLFSRVQPCSSFRSQTPRQRQGVSDTRGFWRASMRESHRPLGSGKGFRTNFIEAGEEISLPVTDPSAAARGFRHGNRSGDGALQQVTDPTAKSRGFRHGEKALGTRSFSVTDPTAKSRGFRGFPILGRSLHYLSQTPRQRRGASDAEERVQEAGLPLPSQTPRQRRGVSDKCYAWENGLNHHVTDPTAEARGFRLFGPYGYSYLRVTDPTAETRGCRHHHLGRAGRV